MGLTISREVDLGREPVKKLLLTLAGAGHRVSGGKCAV